MISRSEYDQPTDPAADIYRQEIDVRFDYPVAFTRGVFDQANPLLCDMIGRKEPDRNHRILCYVDAGLAEASPDLIGRLVDYVAARSSCLALACKPIVIPGGRAAKTDYELIRTIMSTLGEYRMDRQSVVIAVGGGNMLDAVGLATSLVHRGLRLVRIPSTVLSQNDAGVGVKNGIDEHGQKNYIGTFSPPFAVIDDFDLLYTLDDTTWRGGISEAIKVALIKDAAFFDFLRGNAATLRERDSDAMEQLVRRCAVIHLEHIRTSGDPFEFGTARPLDFGHWAAHRLEILSNHRLGHGQAVAVGIALDSCYACRRGLLTEAEFDAILETMVGSGLPVRDDDLLRRDDHERLEVLEGIRQFREHLGGRLTITLPDGIGNRVEIHDIDEELVASCIEYLFTIPGGVSEQ